MKDVNDFSLYIYSLKMNVYTCYYIGRTFLNCNEKKDNLGNKRSILPYI